MQPIVLYNFIMWPTSATPQSTHHNCCDLVNLHETNQAARGGPRR